MKHIQSIFVIFLLIFGLGACSEDETGETSGNDNSFVGTIRLLPVAPSAYSGSTRVTTDGKAWSEGDVVFVRIVFYADEAMTQEISFVYAAMRRGSDGGWGVATGSKESDANADFTFKTVDPGASDIFWNTDGVILWPGNGVKKARVQAVYAGLRPDVELLSGGLARIRVNVNNMGFSEMLTSTRSLSKIDLFGPATLSFFHRLTRLDFGKELENDIQIVSGSSGSGVDMIPETIDFSGAVSARNKITIPTGQRYIYITPEKMVKNDADRIFRLQNPLSAMVVAAFSLPKIPSGITDSNIAYYYGRSYSLASISSGGVAPGDIIIVP